MTGFVCAYFGPPDECPECGGFNKTGGRYCSHDCADDAAQRVQRQDVALAELQAREEEFGRRCDTLRQAGRTDWEIDLLLADYPT